MLVSFKIEKGAIIINRKEIEEKMNAFFERRRQESGLNYYPDERDLKSWVESAQEEINLLNFYYKNGKCYSRLGSPVADGCYQCMGGYLR